MIDIAFDGFIYILLHVFNAFMEKRNGAKY